MPEYIEREAMVEKIAWLADLTGDAGREYGLRAALDVLKRSPVADVTSARHGRWVHNNLAAHWYAKNECSECSYHEADQRDISYYRFCPYCGAKMDLEEDDEE